jgi:hypothetical protein
MRTFCVLLLLLLLQPLAAQTRHAPTVDQCRADQKLWFAWLEDRDHLLPKYPELSAWSNEMMNCMAVDRELSWQYQNVQAEVTAVQLTRVENFLQRHGLIEQFLAEDGATEETKK